MKDLLAKKRPLFIIMTLYETKYYQKMTSGTPYSQGVRSSKRLEVGG